ncbi:MAG: hypothetical protein ACI9G1_005661 [Pirellulaceae bacterium]|jgi:hypothetical protein
MPKALCMTGMVISVLVFVLFTVDLVAPAWIAPFKNANMILDIVFMLCAGAMGYLSWATMREQT